MNTGDAVGKTQSTVGKAVAAVTRATHFRRRQTTESSVSLGDLRFFVLVPLGDFSNQPPNEGGQSTHLGQGDYHIIRSDTKMGGGGLPMMRLQSRGTPVTGENWELQV